MTLAMGDDSDRHCSICGKTSGTIESVALRDHGTREWLCKECQDVFDDVVVDDDPRDFPAQPVESPELRVFDPDGLSSFALASPVRPFTSWIHSSNPESLADWQ